MSDTALMELQAYTPDYDAQVTAFKNANFSDPFSFLGVHCKTKSKLELRAYLPGAEHVYYQSEDQKIAYKRYKKTDLFTLVLARKSFDENYNLSITYPYKTELQSDIYAFASSLDLDAMYLLSEGTLEQAYQHLGAHWQRQKHKLGVRFTVWAPNAQCISIIGDFNHWNNTRHFMRKHPASGVWEIFLPDVKTGQSYKYSILSHEGQRLEKADPFSFSMQIPSDTASIIPTHDALLGCNKTIQEKEYQAQARIKRNAIDKPISIYEVHAGSWQHNSDKLKNGQKAYLSYQALSKKLVPYVKALGFTHIQLMPISEFPFDGSWGYQPVGMYAPTSRFGSLADFQYLVDACHSENIGLLIDWVPGHFPSDPHGLAKFDGSHLYEHADKRQGFHPDWNTHIYNYGRAEVQSFLISNAMYWFDNFAIDGLRVDAVASMLYLDYSREEGQWIPNEHGGRENLSAISLLKQVNQRCYGKFPGIMMAAEESTAWPGVTQFVEHGGLGFGYKWNMGWMNDSLSYMSRDPLYRAHHHNEMTFSLIYAFSENYILPLSHDEVVHGKGSLINKMPGDDWQKFANLRAYFAFMWAHPGKKLLFMGGEFAQYDEWDHDKSLDWHLLEYAPHKGMQNLIKQLNQVYCQSSALYELDNQELGFKWIDGGNAQQSIFSFVRFAKNKAEYVVAISNMTPNIHRDFRIGVPEKTDHMMLFNSDDSQFGGSDFNTHTLFKCQDIPWQGFEQSIYLDIPPLATLYLKRAAL
ncbi:1,4-alpha-glucan branching protein GlgB [Pseudoalteromonas denitrificans]|uniref:1,4-alpha-glucan branching enzyme GlgB n=1 Tax=Pseudoalteromonas denitrificans DSM 6059 TaxID=1123010 RepID=A0A1I1PRI3_9GAMM|nr:1,4-alpha-glucan branching protein GlgB [Pseudoalteromonas denitrificans]SFD12272.1 1,4-alpha-glucan branching enzyme [Pseudoalteromonas denitrificans DSM 6059]